MAYAQWVSVSIVSKGSEVKVRDAHLDWGKFYKSGDKDVELSTKDINNMVIEKSQKKEINSCGRSDAASGTEGHFTLYSDDNVKLGTYSWDCPWGSKTNKSTFTSEVDPDLYAINVSGGNLDSGAIGNITITVHKLD